MRREIVFEEDPSTPRFRARDETSFRSGTNFFGVHVQEFRCFLEVESLHGPLHWFPIVVGETLWRQPSADWLLKREPHSSGKHP
jgi:hypothetical protein